MCFCYVFWFLWKRFPQPGFCCFIISCLTKQRSPGNITRYRFLPLGGMDGMEERGEYVGRNSRWRDKAKGKDICGGGRPVGTSYLPPDCWTGADNKKILIVNTVRGAVTPGSREEGGGRRRGGLSLAGCYIDGGGLDRVNKTPGIIPYRTPAEKWINSYLFRHRFSSRWRQSRFCFLPKVVSCQNVAKSKRATNC